MKTVLTGILVYTFFVCTAQSNLPKQLHLNHLLMEDGLPEGHINKFLLDREGYMWLGTFDGLVRFDGYTAKKYELPSNDLRTSPVLDICEDIHGELWVADYYHGLYRYDRLNNSFIHYIHNADKTNSIAVGGLRCITPDDKGNLWLTILNSEKNIVTIDRFVTATNKFTHYVFADKQNFITTALYQSPVYKDDYGNIWLGSQNGIQKFNFKKNTFESYLNSSIDSNKKTIEIICSDPLNKNYAWLSSKITATNRFDGLLLLNLLNNSVTAYHHTKEITSLASDTVLNIQTDSKKRLWVTTTKGLSLYEYASKNFINYCPAEALQNPSAAHISKFEEDKNGNLWFTCTSGTDPNINANEGLFVFNITTKKFTNYKVNPLQNDGLASNTIRNLYIDRFGDLWFNTSAAGAQWVKKQSGFDIHASEQARKSFFSTDFFNSCAEAKDGSLWLATTGGLYHWFPATDSMKLVLPDNKTNNPILSVLIDDKGLIWYSGDDASTLKGLFCYNAVTGKLENYRVNKNNPAADGSDFIHHILQSNTGALLLCTNAGLYAFDKKTKAFTQYKYAAEGNSALRRTKQYKDLIWTAFEDKEHELWLGTLGSLTKLDINTGRFTYYQKKLPHFQWIQNFYEDRQQRLWASSYNGGGLLIFDRKNNTIKRLFEKDGLLFNGPGSILEDDKGNLWVKTVRGISIINPKTFAIRNLTDDALTESNHLINYAFKTSKGLFIFPSKYGFVTLNPNNFKADTATPIVHIEAVMCNKPQSSNKSVDSTIVRYKKNSIELKYNENRITFLYVGLLYQNTAQIQYRYKLDGYDNNWVDAHTQRSVTYNNLAHGTYTFHVTACNSDGVWSKNEDAISVVIAPPFWETWWFRILLLIFICVAAFYILRYYLRVKLSVQQREFDKLKAIEEVRSKISMDIHDEISSGLTKISLLSQRVESKLEQNKEIDAGIIQKINSSSKEVIDNLSEIIWAVNPKHDNLQSLIAYIRNYTFHFFESTTLQLNIDFPGNIENIAVSPETKHNLFLVIKEALNNIIKHAGATAVDVSFNYNKQFYQFIIKDNGRGMDNSNGKIFGNGLINMRNRMSAINGSIDFVNNDGTKIIIEGKFA